MNFRCDTHAVTAKRKKSMRPLPTANKTTLQVVTRKSRTWDQADQKVKQRKTSPRLAVTVKSYAAESSTIFPDIPLPLLLAAWTTEGPTIFNNHHVSRPFGTVEGENCGLTNDDSIQHSI